MPDENEFENLTNEEYEKLLKPLIDDDFEPASSPVNPYTPPEPSAETLKLVKSFEETIELIHQGKYPNWPEFFETARKLNVDYFIDHGQSTSLADELMSVYEIDVEDLYTDESFLNEIIKILPEEVHFLCFLLNHDYSEKIEGLIINKIWDQLSSLEDPIGCYECGSNRWWGNPIAYLACMKKLSPDNLNKIFEFTSALDDRFEHDIEIVFSALASNEATPKSVLEFLATVDKEPVMASNDQYPFYDENGESIPNISKLAKRTIAKLGK